MTGPTLVCDVAVIGSGVAGLASALEAARAQLNVIVFEAEPELGGASAISGGRSLVVGSPLQERLGIEDDVALALSDWKRAGGPLADLEWARYYLQYSRPWVYDWVEELGVSWCEVRLEEGNSVPRSHLPRGGGEEIVQVLKRALESVGGQLRLGSPVERILIDAGRVVGLVAAGREVTAHATIVCSGGYVSNATMLLEAAPVLRRIERLLGGGGPTAVGRGHQILGELGATFCQLDNVWLYPVGTPNPRDPSGWRGLVVRGLANEIWLNREGRRFHDENRRGGASGSPALLRQPGQTAWGIFDAEEAQRMVLLGDAHFGTPFFTGSERAREFWQTSRYVREAQTLPALTEAIGLPSKAATESLAHYNRAVVAGADSEFGRDLADARPIAASPFRAIRYMPVAQKNFGGVLTDLNCRVRTEAGPVPGLYAAGEVAGMAGGHINGKGSLEGTMFGPCLFSGRVAGRAAVRELTSPR